MVQKNQSELGGDFVRLLANILDESKLTEIEYEAEGVRIRVAKEQNIIASHMAAPATMYAPQPIAQQEAVQQAPSAVINNENAVKSPIVGTAYLSSSPGHPPFVEVGKTVKEGDVLMIIEAMKVMNPLKSPRAGTVKSILVEDGSPIEYGEILMVIE